MTLLIVGIMVFLGLHLLPTVPGLRESSSEVWSKRLQGSVLAALDRGLRPSRLWLRQAPVVQVWSPPDWTRWVAIVLMLPAFIFLVAAYVPGRIKAKLKHPFLVAIKTWALAHLIANGDLASIILFGSFLAYAVFDRITLKRREPTGLITVPATGPPRNDVIAVVLGTVLYVVFLVWLHPLLIGTAPLPQ